MFYLNYYNYIFIHKSSNYLITESIKNKFCGKKTARQCIKTPNFIKYKYQKI